MPSFRAAVFRVAEFLRWSEKGQLEVQPKFQRRAVWQDRARSYLIDTIVRGLPMPKIYLRRIVSQKSRQTVYEVVDGQQRLRAILDFANGELQLSSRDNPDLGDIGFAALPESLRRRFLGYEISTEVMERADDRDVWAMFERLNTYTLTLNKQERLNAKWFGYFKQTAYGLAAEQSSLDVWLGLRVFTPRAISRMTEVEMTSDILVAMLDGISDITAIPSFYKRFDNAFDRRMEVSAAFRGTLAWINDSLADAVRSTKFHTKRWFYSLAVAVADIRYGIPGGSGPREARREAEIKERMRQLDAVARTANAAPRSVLLAELFAAFSGGTSHAHERRVRHTAFVTMLTSSRARWDELVGGES